LDVALGQGLRVSAAGSGKGTGTSAAAPDRPRQPPFLVAVRADAAELAKVKGTPWPSRGGLADVLSLPAFWAVFLYRVANELHERGLKPLSRLVYFANMVVFGADLAPGAVIGPGLVIPHPVGLGVASDVVMGSRCRVMRSTAIGGNGNPHRPGFPTLGDDVWVMDGAKVMGPVHVGDRTVVGAAAVVASDIPADMFVYGARRSDAIRPLAEIGLADHGGSLDLESVV
jgi:serine O-acetyltransferase